MNVVFILFLIELFTNQLTFEIETNQKILLYGMIILIPTVTLLRIKHLISKEVWSIEESILYSRRKKDFKIDLTKVDEAIIGLPYLNIKSSISKFLNSHYTESNNSIAEYVLELSKGSSHLTSITIFYSLLLKVLLVKRLDPFLSLSFHLYKFREYNGGLIFKSPISWVRVTDFNLFHNAINGI